MDAIYLMTMSALALGACAALARGIEASRRHLVCIRFEHDLRRSADREPGITIGAPR